MATGVIPIESSPEREVSASQRLAWERLWQLLLSRSPVDDQDSSKAAQEVSE